MKWNALLPMAALVLAWVSVSAANAQAQAPWPILQLTSQEPRESSNGSPAGSLLLRELHRQAMLIAAREELGLRTRDMAMGDALAEGEGVQTILAGTQFWPKSASETVLAVPGGPGATELETFAQVNVTQYANQQPNRMLARVRYNQDNAKLIFYGRFITETEALSRTTYKNALARSGVLSDLAEVPTKWLETGAALPEALKAMESLEVFSQMAAVRMLHEQIHMEGASPERIEALVRAYAHIGLLTDSLFRGVYKSYMARSLLYAERLVIRKGQTAHTLSVRAYARALAGLDRLALEDMASLKAKGGEAPGWVVLIDPLCKRDLADMKRLADTPGEAQELARMLIVLVAADGYSAETLMRAASACLEKQPHNLWVMHELIKTHQLGTSAVMPAAIRDALASLIEETTGLFKWPADLAAKARVRGDAGFSAMAVFCDALEKHALGNAETGEPSAAALAAIIRETMYRSAFDEVAYLSHMLGAGYASTTAAALRNAPAWQTHPLAGLIEMRTVAPGPESRAALDKAKLIDAGSWFYTDVMHSIPGEDFNAKWRVWLQVQSHGDLIPRDHTRSTLESGRVWRDEFIAQLKNESPHSSLPVWASMSLYPRAKRLEDQAATAKTIADVRAKFGNRTDLVCMAATWSLEMHDLNTAAELLEAYLQADPSHEAAFLLLKVYELTGDIDKAKALVDKAMTWPAASLQVSRLAGECASMLMARYRYAEALPYAEKSAQSYSSSGLVDLANCYDALAQLDRVSEILQANARRYGGGDARWWLWAKRVKRPEAAQARQAYAAAVSNDASESAWLKIYDGDHAGGLKLLIDIDPATLTTMEQVNHACVAGEAGNKARMEALLTKAVSYQGDYDFKEIAQTMLALCSGSNVEATVLKYELTLGPRVNSDQNRENAMIGRTLAALGHKELAARFLTHAIDGPWRTHVFFALSWAALERLGENPDELLAAYRARKVDTSALVGKWQVNDGQTAGEWTFDADRAVTTSQGLHGLWWERDGRILISFTPSKWAVVKWPATGELKGDSQAGVGKLNMRK